MEENSKEEKENLPIIPEADSISKEEETATISENSKPKPETETMEVHHHPQLHHNPKPWKEYFLEFLMIFLAVTLGFFAENLRERNAENHRAKEYAQSLYDDLKVDTMTIQRTFNEKNWIKAKYDSAIVILNDKKLDSNNEFLYYVESYMSFSNDVFTTQDVTYQQLRSSGNFRYLKNIKLYKKIADYYNLYLKYQLVDDGFRKNEDTELSKLNINLFDTKDLNSLSNEHATTYYTVILRPNRKLKPIIKDEKNLKLLYYKLNDEKRNCIGSTIFLGWLKSQATDLLKDLKTEYQLE